MLKFYLFLSLPLIVFSIGNATASEIEYGLNLGYMATSDASPIEEGELTYYGTYIGTKKRQFDIGYTKSESACNDDIKFISYTHTHEILSHKVFWGFRYGYDDSFNSDRCETGGAIINIPTPNVGYRYILSDSAVKVAIELQYHTYGISANTRIGF